MQTVVWQQRVDDIDVFEAQLISHTTKDGDIVNISSHFMADPEAAASRGAPNRAALIRNPTVTVEQALAAAAQNVGQEAASAQVSASGEPAANAEKNGKFRASFLRGDAEAKLTWLPM